ncbi:MAG: hypothetical protein AAFN13_18735, partial [Bacteroidota bacterium]
SLFSREASIHGRLRPAGFLVAISLAAGLWLGCSGTDLIVTEEAYQDREIRGGVLAVPPFAVTTGTSDTDVFSEMVAALEGAEEVRAPGEAVAVLLRESMRNRWYSYSYLDGLILTEAQDGSGSFRRIPVNPAQPGEGMVAVPTDGTMLTYGEETPAYVLFCTKATVKKESRQGIGANGAVGANEAGGSEYYVTELAYALWDNQEGRLIQRGQLTERAQTSILTRSKSEEWARSFDQLVEQLLETLPFGPMEAGKPMTGEWREARIRSYRR